MTSTTPAPVPETRHPQADDSLCPSWLSLAELPAADADFLQERPPIIQDEGRFDDLTHLDAKRKHNPAILKTVEYRHAARPDSKPDQ